VAYFMATNSLYLTTFCLEMRSEIVAATCIYLAFKWSDFEVGLSTDGRQWWSYLDQNLKEDQLIDNVKTYVKILQEHPARLADMKKHCENSRPLHRGPSSSAVAPSAGGSSKPNSTMTSKRSKPDDIDAHAHDQLHKKPKTEEKKPELPPIRPPNSRPLGMDSNSRRSHSGSQSQPEMRTNTPSVPNYSEDSRTTYLPRLRNDFEFLKSCLRNKELWSKLSDEEKEYCKKAKEKMKRRREQERNERGNKEHKKNRHKVRENCSSLTVSVCVVTEYCTLPPGRIFQF
jgi:hypothetical protein